MKNSSQKGFTLIELLVVITIIGILATGAVTVYTSQMTKARDSARLSDIKALQGAIEQSYMDQYTYPGTGQDFGTDIANYMSRLPKDPRSGQEITVGRSSTALDYLYNRALASGSRPEGYELSVAFEGTSGVPSSADDGGNDNRRHEIGVANTATSGGHINTSRQSRIPQLNVSDRCVDSTNGGVTSTCDATNSTVIRGGN